MRFSRLFGKTVYGTVGGSDFVSHQLLTKGGFIRESAAGRYFFLPLGWRVHDKIKQVIKQEMDRAGAQEMLAPVLHPFELWQETNRDRAAGFELTQVVDSRGARFALGGTAEEMFVDVVRKFRLSFKDLPFTVYQFSTKFRDEKRARGGLLRVREFVMKDAYSFNLDETDFKDEYRNMWETYLRVFRRLGLEPRVVEADNGYIGGEYSHEFVVEAAAGESRFLVSEDGHYCAHEDVARFKREAIEPGEGVEPPVKRVAFKNRTSGELIIASIRGDLEVNPVKLEHVLDAVGLLEEATGEDLKQLATELDQAGVRYVRDLSLETVGDFPGEPDLGAGGMAHGGDVRGRASQLSADIAMAQPGFLTEDGSQKLLEKRGIEVGNIFQLGYHYSQKMKNATYVDREGKAAPFYMGCYGIGLGRTMATIVEVHHDARGITWPAVVAPYQAHLISLKGAEERGEEAYRRLVEAGIQVIWDDRAESPGVKFADADLIGNPIRLVVSSKTQRQAGFMVERKRRTEADAAFISLEEAIRELRE